MPMQANGRKYWLLSQDQHKKPTFSYPFCNMKRSVISVLASAGWIRGFVMIWLVIGNLDVLPMGILPFAIPLSILEAFVASWIIHKLK